MALRLPPEYDISMIIEVSRPASTPFPAHRPILLLPHPDIGVAVVAKTHVELAAEQEATALRAAWTRIDLLLGLAVPNFHHGVLQICGMIFNNMPQICGIRCLFFIILSYVL
jgi:hypothetical protein